MKITVAAAALLVGSPFAFGLAGCVSSGTEVTQAQAAQFHRGISTESDVIARLGTPNASTVTADGKTIITYAHVQARPDAVDFVPIVGASAGGATAQTTAVTFTFGPDGNLMDYTATSANSHANVGVGN